MKSTLKKKQIVWARTKGHPWWPGIITQVQDGKYVVDFIGDDSQQGSILMSDNLFDFQEKFDEFNDKGKKNKKLKEAIQNAQKLLKKQKKTQRDNKVISKRNLRQFKKYDTPIEDNIQKSPLQETPQTQQKKQYLDREFQDLLLLLIAAQLNYDQIKQKLTPILDTIEAQVTQNSTITEVLSERKGSILNAVYLILKHQSEQNPDHFFQRDIQQQITRLHELISKLKNSLLNQFFNAASIIQNLSEVCTNTNRGLVITQIMNQNKIVEKKPSQITQTPPKKRKKDMKKEKLEKKNSENQTTGNSAVQFNNNDNNNNNNNNSNNSNINNSNNNNNNNNSNNNNNQNLQDQLKKEQIENEKIKIDEKKNNNEQTKIIKQDGIIQKKMQKKNEIPDQALRRKVCLNMLELVQLLGLEEEQAKKITIRIESLGREADPLMRNKYAKLMWHCIVNLDCKLIKREELLSLIDENADQNEAWSKLTLQPIDRTRKLIHI
ncbi:unnamed protein product [Paramecium sonneborni]|uniref:PWWP domain-containing protein n=1 Tax=Paramecium sonneborni TaxID=65129 RepID=A0A8S1QWJ7_9CILI|nr:unnamed protein product [Paramecium sonneborni]